MLPTHVYNQVDQMTIEQLMLLHDIFQRNIFK